MVQSKEGLKKLLALKLQIADQILDCLPNRRFHRDLISVVQEVTSEYLEKDTEGVKASQSDLKTVQIE